MNISQSTVTENNKDIVLSEMPIQTDKEIKAQNMIQQWRTKKKRTFVFIDMSVLTKRSTSSETTENLCKYKEIEIGTERI